jgi:hypothetical protein
LVSDKDPIVTRPEFGQVIDFGAVQVARGYTRTKNPCAHKRLTYDVKDRRIWCSDCESTVEGFDAFMTLVRHAEEWEQRAQVKMDKAREAEAATIVSRAAKEVDRIWRGRLHVPACPHCKQGLFPENFANGVSTVLGREYALARLRTPTRAEAGTGEGGAE